MAQTLVQRTSPDRVAPVLETEPVIPDAALPVSPPAPSRQPRGRRRLLIALAILLVTGGAVAGIAYWIHGQHYESTDDATLEGHVIPISTQVAATVLAVHALDNQVVRKGDVLVDLDPTDYQVAVEQAKGSLAAMEGKLSEARTKIAAAEAQRDEAKAQLDAAQTNFENADNDLKRYQSLDERARSKEQLDNAISAQKSGQAAVEQAKAKVAIAQSQIATAQATVLAAQGDVEKARADLRRAKINLGYCQIKASEDGRITRKSVEPGAYVTPGEALLAIVPTEVWVVANFKETQLTYMRPGQPVIVHLDAYPGYDFKGHVDSIQSGTGARFSMLPAENATGNFVKIVQRVPVKIILDADPNGDPSRSLVPGMSVEAEVHVR
jgi:membrane fusion protein (multidrug efflux system)